MEGCEVEPRYTIEQIDLLQRLRLSGMTKPQIIHALESLERLDPEHRQPLCDSHPAPPNSGASSSSSSSSLSLASATTQTSGLDGAALSPSNSYEASPPPLYPPSVVVQRAFSYDMMGEEEWDLEEKVEEYMRRDSNLVKEEIKTFLNNRRISQAIVGQVTGISQSYISQWLLQQGLEMSDSKRRAFYRWYLLERNNPGLRWSESQHSVSPRARGGVRDGTVAGASGSLPNPNTSLLPNHNPSWSRQRELLMHLLPWYTAAAAAAAAQSQPGNATRPRWRAAEDASPLNIRRCFWNVSSSFFMENQYPDEAKREEIASACNSVIQKPGCKLSEFERVTALKVYNWFANRRKEMKRRANIEAAILESHGIEVPSPSCHSNGEEGELQEFVDQVPHRFSEQEETTSQKLVDQQDRPSLTGEAAAPPQSPGSRATEQKEEDSKRESVDEE
uniref:Homeobox-containing protein 1 n=1 Tax=Cyprinodon variegatus TaxID=28743 RepID=A0A3Q2E532_CYPVA